MEKKLRNYTCMAAVFAVCSAMISCSGTAKNNSSSGKENQESVVVEKESEKGSFKTAALSLPDGMTNIADLVQFSGGAYLAATDSESNFHIYRSNASFDEYIPYDLRDIGKNNYMIMAAQDDKLWTLNTVTTYEGLPEPDYDDPDTDWLMYEEAAVHSYSLDCYDSSGKLVSTAEITGLDESLLGSGGAVIAFNVCSDGSFDICFSNELVKIGSDGAVIKSEEMPSEQYMSCGFDSSGNIICAAFDDDYNAVIYTADAESFKFSDGIAVGDSGYIENIVPGSGDYTAYLSKGDGIYGFKDGTLLKLLDWTNTGITDARMFIPYGEGFIVAADGKLKRAVVRTEEELGEMEIIKMAALGGFSKELQECVNQFNFDNDGKYMIEVVDDYIERYGADLDGKEGQGQAFGMALLAGDFPDLVYAFDFTILQNVAAMGAFTDMYEFIDNDTDISREDFLPNVLKLNEYDGKLSILPQSFSLCTLAAKDKWICGTGENWTGDQMLEAVRNMPDGMAIDFISRDPDSVMWNYLFHTSASYIDYENRTCSFNSPEFIAMLNMAKDGPFIDMDYDDPNWEAEEKTACKEDKALLNSDCRTFSDYLALKESFGGDDFTLVGYPSADGKGGSFRFGTSFGIMEASQHKEAAWEFVKTFFSDAAQKEVANMETGAAGEGCSVFVKYNDYDDKKFTDYINSIDKVSAYDYDVFNIIQEEAAYFFNGEHTAEQAAEFIQNRVSILISEQSW